MVGPVVAGLGLNTALAILASLGGVAAFLGAIAVVVRAIFRQISAIEDNTGALKDLKTEVVKLDTVVSDHTMRIQRVEDRLATRRVR